jgi:two-component system KDP operon response regulator KdpE
MLQAATSQAPDVVLLDPALPDTDGIEVIEKLRGWSGVPIIVISAHMLEKEKVAALDAGADDYVTKPFGSSELLARIRAALRHSPVAPEANEEIAPYESGGLTVDVSRHRVICGGKDVHLTQIEFLIISTLASNPGKVITYDYLLRKIWGPSAAEGSNQILRVNIANIRRKIETNHARPEHLMTEQGIGYYLRDVES